MPRPVHRRHGQRRLLPDPAFVEANKAATGIGQGAAIPAPNPTKSPAGTERGIFRPIAAAGSSSRMATALANPTAPANPSAASRSAVFSTTIPFRYEYESPSWDNVSQQNGTTV